METNLLLEGLKAAAIWFFAIFTLGIAAGVIGREYWKAYFTQLKKYSEETKPVTAELTVREDKDANRS